MKTGMGKPGTNQKQLSPKKNCAKSSGEGSKARATQGRLNKRG